MNIWNVRRFAIGNIQNIQHVLEDYAMTRLGLNGLGMLDDMIKLDFPIKTQFRTHDSLRSRFKIAIEELRDSGVSYDNDAPNIENVSNALWLWFAKLPRDQAEQFLRDLFPLVEQFMGAANLGVMQFAHYRVNAEREMQTSYEGPSPKKAACWNPPGGWPNDDTESDPGGFDGGLPPGVKLVASGGEGDGDPGHNSDGEHDPAVKESRNKRVMARAKKQDEERRQSRKK